MYGIVSGVAGEDLVDALVEGEFLAIGAGRQISEGERVEYWTVLDFEGGQLVGQVALLGLESSTRVVGHKTADAERHSLLLEPPSAIQGVEPRAGDQGRVANVVKVCGSDQHIAVARRDRGGGTFGSSGDSTGVGKAFGERGELCLCLLSGPGAKVDAKVHARDPTDLRRLAAHRAQITGSNAPDVLSREVSGALDAPMDVQGLRL
jgi:hypothetical protein